MDIYAPVITEEDDEFETTAHCLDVPEPIEEQSSLTAPDIIANLALAIDQKNHPSFSATLKDVSDEGIVKVLEEIQNAATLESLQDVIFKNSTLLQTAGCFRHVSNIKEKHTILEEYVRFKDGLATLNFLTALQNHQSVLAPFLSHTEKKLTQKVATRGKKNPRHFAFVLWPL
ncbi:hypothetical protein Q7C36_008072 [Tachysurus vachellii]|uniref:Uncharacterized protein n=1 Tax=Tachysurus vachellii TaxID=175792 RepID=A0AA88T034_TACVA|nr:hypothetical protein Q7C36_008072 [Tachysurus vachellii]